MGGGNGDPKATSMGTKGASLYRGTPKDLLGGGGKKEWGGKWGPQSHLNGYKRGFPI